jgi:hypothetical protein
MGSVLLESAAALRGGWRDGFVGGSFRGKDYDELVASMVTEPAARLILDRAVTGGKLHGDLAADFPIDTALSCIGVLRGERPHGTLVVARDRYSQLFPVPAELNYVILVRREGNVATYTVAFPGTVYGNTIIQTLTDVNPLCSKFDLMIDGSVYQHNMWQGFYASVTAGKSPPVIEIMRHLSAAVRSTSEGAEGDVEHKLVVTGYSIGATQALLIAMLYCDDSMQKSARTMGISRGSFSSVTVILIAMPNAVRSGDTCAYVKRAVAKLGVALYSVVDPLDFTDHLYGALPLSRAAVPHIHTIEEDGVYRIEAASVVHGTMFRVARRISWWPSSILNALRSLWRMLRVVASAHMLVEYERKLVSLKSGQESPAA